MITAIILVLLGYVGHSTKRYTETLVTPSSDGFARLTEHVIGTVMLYIAFLVTWRKHGRPATFSGVTTSFAEAALEVGIGDALAYAAEDAE